MMVNDVAWKGEWDQSLNWEILFLKLYSGKEKRGTEEHRHPEEEWSRDKDLRTRATDDTGGDSLSTKPTVRNGGVCGKRENRPCPGQSNSMKLKQDKKPKATLKSLCWPNKTQLWRAGPTSLPGLLAGAPPLEQGLGLLTSWLSLLLPWATSLASAPLTACSWGSRPHWRWSPKPWVWVLTQGTQWTNDTCTPLFCQFRNKIAIS